MLFIKWHLSTSFCCTNYTKCCINKRLQCRRLLQLNCWLVCTTTSNRVAFRSEFRLCSVWMQHLLILSKRNWKYMSAAMQGEKCWLSWQAKCSAICSLRDETAPYSIIREIQEVGILPPDGTTLPSTNYELHLLFPGYSQTMQNSDLFWISQASTALVRGIEQNASQNTSPVQRPRADETVVYPGQLLILTSLIDTTLCR